MKDSLQRTLVLSLAIVALTVLAGLATLTGHDASGTVLNMVVAGLLGIAGAAAGSHAANGKGPTILRGRPAGDDEALIVGDRRDTPPPPPARPA